MVLDVARIVPVAVLGVLIAELVNDGRRDRRVYQSRDPGDFGRSGGIRVRRVGFGLGTLVPWRPGDADVAPGDVAPGVVVFCGLYGEGFDYGVALPAGFGVWEGVQEADGGEGEGEFDCAGGGFVWVRVQEVGGDGDVGLGVAGES